MIQRLKLEGHRHLFENFKHVTTSDIADAWLSANKTRDWTILVEALLTEPGLGCAVSGVLPLSKKCLMNALVQSSKLVISICIHVSMYPCICLSAILKNVKRTGNLECYKFSLLSLLHIHQFVLAT